MYILSRTKNYNMIWQERAPCLSIKDFPQTMIFTFAMHVTHCKDLPLSVLAIHLIKKYSIAQCILPCTASLAHVQLPGWELSKQITYESTFLPDQICGKRILCQLSKHTLQAGLLDHKLCRFLRLHLIHAVHLWPLFTLKQNFLVHFIFKLSWWAAQRQIH